MKSSFWDHPLSIKHVHHYNVNVDKCCWTSFKWNLDLWNHGALVCVLGNYSTSSRFETNADDLSNEIPLGETVYEEVGNVCEEDREKFFGLVPKPCTVSHFPAERESPHQSLFSRGEVLTPKLKDTSKNSPSLNRLSWRIKCKAWMKRWNKPSVWIFEFCPQNARHVKTL